MGMSRSSLVHIDRRTSCDEHRRSIGEIDLLWRFCTSGRLQWGDSISWVQFERTQALRDYSSDVFQLLGSRRAKIANTSSTYIRRQRRHHRSMLRRSTFRASMAERNRQAVSHSLQSFARLNWKVLKTFLYVPATSNFRVDKISWLRLTRVCNTCDEGCLEVGPWWSISRSGAA